MMKQRKERKTYRAGKWLVCMMLALSVYLPAVPAMAEEVTEQ